MYITLVLFHYIRMLHADVVYVVSRKVGCPQRVPVAARITNTDDVYHPDDIYSSCGDDICLLLFSV